MTTRFIATRDFKDSGTEREFPAGPMPDDVDEGTLGNYLAAGLIRERNEGDAIVEDIIDKPTSPKPAPKRTRQRAKRDTTKSTATKPS